MRRAVLLGAVLLLVSLPAVWFLCRALLGRVLNLTKGNLAVHVSRREKAGTLQVDKGFVGKVPRTTDRATPKGRRDFAAYLAVLEEVIATARG